MSSVYAARTPADDTALGYWENRQGIAGGVLAPMYTYSQLGGGQNVGTTIASHLRIAEQQGVDNRADYWQGNYDHWDLPTSAEGTNAANWKLTSFSEPTIQPSSSANVTQMSIEVALAAGYPVVIGFPVYDNFMSFTGSGGGFYEGPAGAYDGSLSRGRWIVRLAVIAPPGSREWAYRFVVRVGAAR